MAYPANPNLRASTLALLSGIWTKLPAAVARARAWGADWCERSTPFIHTIDGEVVAHVGVLEIPVVIDGRAQTVAGVHAVCTAAELRGRGHMRACMEAALAWIDARHATAILWANDPAIYTRFGFASQAESIFVGPVVGGREDGVRLLARDDPADMEFLTAQLARRSPVSQRAATHEPGWLALIDLALWTTGPSLAWIPALECVVVYAVRDRFLDLYDVIGASIPSLADIAAHVGPGVDTAITYFCPDALGDHTLVAEPTVLIDQLMVRGAWPSDPQPLAFAPLGRC
ncbi:Acetyltransferase, GNAT family, potentially associated with YqeK [Enhygromyxa salina]|uniref:Acetyltransferase, GNAT family, potentially associated with YqeK n=1 Tax=Enhygromyxa salina TaxID=215803 RepID=A0A0C2D5H5_9BACT|nr:GNAT family N-acetyltransferase [Enhygromyxa salina]KIG18426.1 Acetyltransferase, GNAT family, potentially associated with YqeK [Enhygromyxa salina]